MHAHFGTNSATVAMFAHLLGGASYSFTVHGPEEFDKRLNNFIEKTKENKLIKGFGGIDKYY